MRSEAKQIKMSEFGAEKGLLQSSKEKMWLLLETPALPSGFHGRDFKSNILGGAA